MKPSVGWSRKTKKSSKTDTVALAGNVTGMSNTSGHINYIPMGNRTYAVQIGGDPQDRCIVGPKAEPTVPGAKWVATVIEDTDEPRDYVGRTRYEAVENLLTDQHVWTVRVRHDGSVTRHVFTTTGDIVAADLASAVGPLLADSPGATIASIALGT